MRASALIVPVCGLFIMIMAQVGHAVTDGYSRGERFGNADFIACTPPVNSRIAARLYSYQVPILIQNELLPGETVWAYADACVKAPPGWVPGQEVDSGLREGKTWASFAINRDPPSRIWQAGFPPDDAVRTEHQADDFRPLGSGSIYIPAFGPFQGPNPPVTLVDAPEIVPVGVSQQTADLLREAGMIVEQNRVWAEYSDHPDARQGRSLRPYKVMRRWVHAYNLLCDASTGEKRTGSNSDLARTMMIRKPMFPFELAEDFDCQSSHDKDSNGLRKWGGGIVVYHLFPNLELTPLYVTAEDGVVQVPVHLINHSPAAGPVHLYYQWAGTGAWQEYGETVTLKPYQNTGRGEAALPFIMRIPGPAHPDRLTVLAWPDPDTGLANSGPDLELATPAVLANDAALDWVFETYSVELTLADNRQSADVYPVFTCDLRVSLDAPAQATMEGFTFTATAIRQGCTDLQQVVIEANVNGFALREPAAFSGETAVAVFESGPLFDQTSIWIEAIIDPDNVVAETNEENNRAGQAVLLEAPAFMLREEVLCPTGEPPEKCFRSRLIN